MEILGWIGVVAATTFFLGVIWDFPEIIVKLSISTIVVLGLVFACLTLTGRDGVIKTTKIGEPRYDKRLGSCHKMGFCHTCGLDFNGDYTCGFRMSSQCRGERNETVQVQTIKEKFESGKERERDLVTIVEAGECR